MSEIGKAVIACFAAEFMDKRATIGNAVGDVRTELQGGHGHGAERSSRECREVGYDVENTF